MISLTQYNFEIPFERPDIMYFVPGIYGWHNYGQEDIQICQNLVDHLNGLIVT
jgi:hypothetical protein